MPGVGHPIVADSGWYQHAEYAGDAVVASGLPGVEATGLEIDRLTVHGGALALSAKAILPYRAVIASGGALIVASGVLEHREEQTEAYSTFLAQLLTATVVANDDGSAVSGVAQVDIDLSGAKRYIRHRFTPAVVGSGTATVGPAIYDFGGFDRRPVS